MSWIILVFATILGTAAARDLNLNLEPDNNEVRLVKRSNGGAQAAQTQFKQCTLPDGRPGQCKRFNQCKENVISSESMAFLDNLCVFDDVSVGVCCPKIEDNPVATLAGTLPAVAPLEEENEALLKIERAENRGCGVSTRGSGRLVGARPANPREWPWMVSITPEGMGQYCGGVLITDRHVLTAAHCTRRWTAEELSVRLGEYDLDRDNDTRTYNFRVKEIIQHTEFDSSNYHNDIAILKLDRPTMFNTYVWPICLPPPGLEIVNQTAYIIGWGTLYFGGPSSNVLMEVPVPIWEQNKCIESFSDSIFDETICAAGYEGGKDACQGDSGGPLMYQLSSGRWTVVGVVSWGIRCGEPQHPGLYTRVDKYLSWIVQNARF